MVTVALAKADTPVQAVLSMVNVVHKVASVAQPTPTANLDGKCTGLLSKHMYSLRYSQKGYGTCK
jgi:hypothetical protein